MGQQTAKQVGWLTVSKSGKTIHIKDNNNEFIGFFHISSFDKMRNGENNQSGNVMKSVALMKFPTRVVQNPEDV